MDKNQQIKAMSTCPLWCSNWNWAMRQEKKIWPWSSLVPHKTHTQYPKPALGSHSRPSYQMKMTFRGNWFVNTNPRKHNWIIQACTMQMFSKVSSKKKNQAFYCHIRLRWWFSSRWMTVQIPKILFVIWKSGKNRYPKPNKVDVKRGEEKTPQYIIVYIYSANARGKASGGGSIRCCTWHFATWQIFREIKQVCIF